MCLLFFHQLVCSHGKNCLGAIIGTIAFYSPEIYSDILFLFLQPIYSSASFLFIQASFVGMPIELISL